MKFEWDRDSSRAHNYPYAFVKDERGSVLPLVAICMMALVATIGLAMDGSRMFLMHSKLQGAVDAAGLSAAAHYSTSNVSAQARKFTEANFLAASIGARIDSVVATPSADEQIITIVAEASAPATFMRVFGREMLSATARTEITRAGKGGIELSLVLDVTGSMSSNNKIGSLKTASNNLLDILFGNDATDDLLHIGIIPFSESVNIGTSHPLWMKSITPSWKGCVEARFSSYDIKDDPPSITMRDTLFDPADKSDLNCPPAVTPLTSVKATLKTAVSKLTPSGSTHIAMGAAWGWYMLSPKWQGKWGGTMGSTLPLASGTKGMTKAMVIMTDGDNTWETDTSYGPISCGTTNPAGKCTTYKTDGRLNVSATNENKIAAPAEVALNERLTSVCTQIKNAGITIYTVSLGTVAKETGKRLESCASQSSYYFASATGSALTEAFAKIGDSLSQLRVSR